jgi:ubiquinone biosynthesis protein
MKAPALLRLAAILAVTAGIAASRLPRLLRAATRGRRHLRQATGEMLADAVEALGPVFIKMAQMISYRTDLFSADVLDPLARLQDRVKPLSRRDARIAVEAGLGLPLWEAFSAFSDQPIASGSIAVVCGATTRGGQSVAVKVVRPGVSGRIARDLACFRAIARLLSRAGAVRDLPIVETFDAIAAIISAQADMIAESRSLTAFRAMLPAGRRLVVPRPLLELTTRDVLVMELIEDAMPLTQAPISDRAFRRAAHDLLDLLYAMIFVEGVVHCDMHPGNLLYRADGSLALIDGGLIAVLRDQDRVCFREFFLGLVVNDPEACAGAILKSALHIPDDLDQAGFRRDVATLVRDYHGRTAGSFLIVTFVFRVFELQRGHRLPGTPGFVSAIWALVMFEGLVRTRHPNLDFQAAAQPFLMADLVVRSRRSVTEVCSPDSAPS